MVVGLININMRCIEIILRYNVSRLAQININMRCIEILLPKSIFQKSILININMRCIEIIVNENGFLFAV